MLKMKITIVIKEIPNMSTEDKVLWLINENKVDFG